MLPLVDLHCHLLAGLDDGPKTLDDALAMCRLAAGNGTRLLAAGAHQNPQWAAVTPAVIRAAANRLAERLGQENLELKVFPSAEVMVAPEMFEAWQRGELMSVADRGQYLLVEYPHDQYVDLREIASRFRDAGVQLILAHPERCPELLGSEGRLEDLIEAGCLVQVSASSITRSPSRDQEQALRDWFRRDLVHVLGSDGHGPVRRRPLMGDAYRRLVEWVGELAAQRVASINGMAIVEGTRLRVPAPQRAKKAWYARWW